MTLNTATLLTLFRIALIPVLVVVFFLPYAWAPIAAAAVFAGAAITDWLDGWVARRFHQTSPFGAFLDPVADKLTVVVALFLLVQADPSALMAVVGAIIVGREITVSALREWMSELGERARVKVAGIGKIKTIVQMVALVMALYRLPLFGLPIYEIGQVLLVAAAGLTLWSGLVYIRAAWPVVMASGNDGKLPPEA
ncbi:MAG TPA: CDP-diacylglycerol--glycerol-3-phosphate 3-phosphatidyltransferase [Xanthomonadaceae bacterium]|nr:CDP-diacylglycerol--glycerol-3-phosphate 3-phosphatidyltransferase [Xanthomonadaceae bacterium]